MTVSGRRPNAVARSSENAMTAAGRILHISADFPDPIVPQKTRAVQSLIHLVDDRFDNEVLSLNRKPVDWPAFGLSVLAPGGLKLQLEQCSFGDGLALSYHAPPRGLLHRTMLEKLGQVIADKVASNGAPDLVVGHKLTVEGIAAARAAQILGRPYALTIQGDTDTKILAARPDLSPMYRRIFHQAAMVVSFAPWSLRQVEARLGKRTGMVQVVPCPTELDSPTPPQPVASGLLSVFHLQSAGRKNLSLMTQAMRLLNLDGHEIDLAIVGGGGEAEVAAARKLAAGCTKVRFEGALNRDRISQRMNRAACFVLPSKRETFGLVFIEALFAGCPVIYPAHRAIDGYFEELPFAIAVDPCDARALAHAILYVIENQATIKQALKEWQTSAHARQFTRPSIGDVYAAALNRALTGDGA